MSSQQTVIPAFYTIAFKYVDPICCSLGVYLSAFQTQKWLDSFSPTALYPPNIETTVVNGQLTGFYATILGLQLFTAWGRPKDIGLWRAFQASVCLVDAISTYYMAQAVNAQNRLSPSLWRGEEYQNILGYAGIGLIRLAFVLGVGMGKKGRKTA